MYSLMRNGRNRSTKEEIQKKYSHLFRMAVLKVVAALFLCFSSCLACITSFCVANVNVQDCQLLSLTNYTTLQGLSDLSNFCETVVIYLARGDHQLTLDLSFSYPVQDVNITGIVASTVRCKNASAGIKFHQTSSVNIKNLTLLGCSEVRFPDASVSLYFFRTSYSLQYVTIANSIGFGLASTNCNHQVINNCTFKSNRMGNIYMRFLNHYPASAQVEVHIANTSIVNGSSLNGGGGMHLNIEDHFQCNLIVDNCIFHGNKAVTGSHLHMQAKKPNSPFHLPIKLLHTINISSSTFSDARNCSGSFGVLFQVTKPDIDIDSSVFTDNSCGAIKVTIPNSMTVRNCVIKNNKEIGFHFIPTGKTQFLNTTFHNNSRALYMVPPITCLYSASTININHCNFTENNLKRTSIENAAVLELGIIYCDYQIRANIVINNSNFERNYGKDTDAVLYFTNVANTAFRNVVVQDNNFTGISIRDCSVQIQGNVSVMRNAAKFGGGIMMIRSASSKQFSSILFTQTGILSIVNNTASAQGGGISTDETCLVRNSKEACPFQFEVHNKKQLYFSGNRAGIGGDAMSGGCLSNCSICSTENNCQVNDTIWKYITSKNEQSLSTFAEYPKLIVFCKNVATNRKNISTQQISVYSGELFRVYLVVADEFLVPSKVVIQAKLEQDSSRTVYLGNSAETLELSQKYCSNFSFSIIGKAPGESANVHFFIQNQFITSSQSAHLYVNLQACPFGFTYAEEKGQCDCIPALKSMNVECVSADYSLKVPRQIWIGDFRGEVAINQYCLYCTNGKNKTSFSLNASRKNYLCIENRTGVLCDSCAQSFSLHLGSYHCGKCSKFSYQGVLLLLLFIILGIILIILLLGLNLLVSTGMINALVFYSNIVHFSRENFLPVGTELSNTWLEKAVKFISVFQAWMNLDFGITTCFFKGYDIYASAWMQFLFPVYIWLLIMLIVLASRYSTKISRLTSSSTVPVLATLLLLSYTKLLLTSISAFSFTYLHFLDSSSKHPVWLLDGNISYLRERHVPLFLVSIVCVLAFIIPFTLLILLGPQLQSKSDHRYLHWVNKIKPLLDAFYGPYTKKYRYWPGLLLLARIILFTIVAFYSLGDTPYTTVVISVTIVIVFVTWIFLARPHSVLPYRTRALNYLEVFFLANLALFSMASSYFQYTKSYYIVHQQILAVVMVGTVFLVLCGIIIFQISSKVGSFEVVKKFKSNIMARVQLRGGGTTDVALRKVDVKSDSNSTPPTQSTIELMCSPAVENELREPLLTD